MLEKTVKILSIISRITKTNEREERFAIKEVTRLESKASRKKRDDNENGWRREREGGIIIGVKCEMSSLIPSRLKDHPPPLSHFLLLFFFIIILVLP